MWTKSLGYQKISPLRWKNKILFVWDHICGWNKSLTTRPWNDQRIDGNPGSFTDFMEFHRILGLFSCDFVPFHGIWCDFTGFRVIWCDFMEFFDVFLLPPRLTLHWTIRNEVGPSGELRFVCRNFFSVMVRSPYPLDGNKKTIARQKTLLPVQIVFQCLVWTMLFAYFCRMFYPNFHAPQKSSKLSFFLWQYIISLTIDYIVASKFFGGANLKKVNEHVPRQCTNCGSGWAWGKCEDEKRTHLTLNLTINIEPQNGGLEDDYPFQTGDFKVPG